MSPVTAKGLTGHGGTAAVRELADAIGLTAALSAAARPACPAGLVHDRARCCVTLW